MRMLDKTVRGRKAWTRESLRPEDYLVCIPDDSIREIDAMIAALRASPLQTEVLTADDVSMPRCRALMRRVKRILDSGVGFAVLDRLPVARFDKAELRTVYWVLSSLIARPVAQSFSGTLLYDVTDTGKRKNPKVRADVTADPLDFHTDFGYNLPPTYFGLQVLRTAKKGGRSSVVSLYSAHNAMRRRHPALLRRLYKPFYLNRYGEHAPGDPVASFYPVFRYDGTALWGRFNLRNIIAGYEMAGKTLDAAGEDAINAFSKVLEDPALRFDFDLAPGQAEYLMNWRCAHSRTAYEDHEEPDRRRHLIRIFLRDEGGRGYHG
ncbi:MAG: TauD/TfdA family dioxygenase [Alphaproteobacteria bacterium]|nr:TauD/TfdA family dioxygenase [Alphaproteobacteria bacterium]